jgi:hypothetical protein
MLCSQQGKHNAPLFALLDKAAQGSCKTGDFAQALAIEMYITKTAKGKQAAQGHDREGKGA